MNNETVSKMIDLAKRRNNLIVEWNKTEREAMHFSDDIISDYIYNSIIDALSENHEYAIIDCSKYDTRFVEFVIDSIKKEIEVEITECNLGIYCIDLKNLKSYTTDFKNIR